MTNNTPVKVIVSIRKYEASKVTIVFPNDVNSELLQKLNVQLRMVKAGFFLLRDLIEVQNKKTKMVLCGFWNNDMYSETEVVSKLKQVLSNCGYLNVIIEKEMVNN